MRLKVFVLCCVLGGACTYSAAIQAAPISKKITSRVTDSAINTSLEVLSLPENQRRLGEILSSPAVTRSAHAITLSVVNGVFDGLEKRVHFDSQSLIDGLDDNVRKHFAPNAGLMTRTIVGAAMNAALSEENARRSHFFALATVDGVMKGLAQSVQRDLGPSLAYTVEHDLGPAAASVLEHQVMPAIARGLSSPEMQAAIGATTASIARNLVRGADAGMTTAQAQKEAEGKDSKLTSFGGQIAKGYTVALFFVFALATALIVLALLLVRNSRKQRQLAEQGKRREEAFLAILEQLETENPTIKSNLRELVQDQLHHP